MGALLKITGNFLRDFPVLIPQASPQVLFDVGANVGQTSEGFLKNFPNAFIHAFEPNEAAFTALKELARHHSRLTVHNYGLGGEAGEGRMLNGGAGPTNRVVPLDSGSGNLVNLKTGDEIVAALGIQEISLLKIDTEGFDYDCLKGFRKTFQAGSVSVVKAECGFGARNDTHAPFGLIRDLMESFGFEVLGFYDQVLEWKLRRTQLRRADVVFIKADLAASHPPFVTQNKQA